MLSHCVQHTYDFFHMPSTPFYILYMICGLSDVLDGIIARKTNTASSFGARLDTIADFIFVTVLLMFWINFKYSAMVVCVVATFAAIQEGYYIRKGREIV